MDFATPCQRLALAVLCCIIPIACSSSGSTPAEEGSPDDLAPLPDGNGPCAPGADADGDGIADIEGCDVCLGQDDTLDTDGDGIPNGCDICGDGADSADADGDGVPDDCDVCAEGADDEDADGDGIADACDACPGSDDNGPDVDGDGLADACDTCGPATALADSPVLAFRLGETSAETTPLNLAATTDDYPSDDPLLQLEYGPQTVLNGPGVSADGDTAADFSSANLENYLLLNPVPAEFPTEAFTFEAWVYLSDQSTGAILSYAVPSQNNEFLVLYEGGELRLYVDGGLTGTGVALPTRQWTHLTLSWQSSDGAYQVYIDGAPQLTDATALEGRSIDAGGSMTLGQEQDNVGGNFNASQAFDGRLDEVMLYNTVLTPEQVLAHAQQSGQCGSTERCDGIDNNGNGAIDEGVLGTDWVCPALDCAAILEDNAGASDGDYWIDPDGDGAGVDPMQATCDMSTADGGWTLVLNYLHLGDTNPALTQRADSLPLQRSAALGEDGSLATESWGHAQPSLLAAFNADEDNPRLGETRWYCLSDSTGTNGNDGRVLHFVHASEATNGYISSGSGRADVAMAEQSNNTLLPGHTANLPEALDNGFTNQGNDALTSFPFYLGGTYHWGIRGQGSRWECDDYPNNSDHNTFHQVWVRPPSASAQPQ